jgi:hypothetical protein
MTLYSIVLFLHVVAALAYFVGFGLEWASLVHVRRASTAEQAREWLGLRAWVMPLGLTSLVLILLSGLYMAATLVGWMGWIVVALASLILIAIIGATLTGLRIGAIEKAAAAESGPLSPALRQRLNDPLLLTSIQTRTAIALGIVFLMAVQPDLAGALLTIGIAIVLGLASSLPIWRRAPAKGEALRPRA